MGLLLKGKRNLARVVEEAEILNTFFEVFSSKSSPQESLTRKTGRRFGERLLLSTEDWVRGHLVKFDIQVHGP